MTKASRIQRDLLFEAVAKRRRRCELGQLAAAEGPLTVDELSVRVAAFEQGAGRADLADETVERVRLSLYHCDVPKLSAAGLVEYDEAENAVSLTAIGADVESDPGLLLQDG